jgi:hypothetical protein
MSNPFFKAGQVNKSESSFASTRFDQRVVNAAGAVPAKLALDLIFSLLAFLSHIDV